MNEEEEQEERRGAWRAGLCVSHTASGVSDTGYGRASGGREAHRAGSGWSASWPAPHRPQDLRWIISLH